LVLIMENKANKKRVKPRKSVEQRDHEIVLTVRLVTEIHQLSKQSLTWLSTKLFNGTISGELLRQYVSGHKVASIYRRRQIAQAAKKHGFFGIESKLTLKETGLLREDPYSDHYRKIMRKEEEKALALAEKGVAALGNVFSAEDAKSLLVEMVERLCHPYVDVNFDDTDE
jgi:hypothetical protein